MTLNPPKVSVVIPAYNSVKFLPDALESALQQTFKDIEVIIINDGSSDNTQQWVLKHNDPRITLISQQNLGKSAARNRGISHSKGEYIAFLDADDIWEPTKLEKQVNCLDAHPDVGLVYTWTALADETGLPTGRITASHSAGRVWKSLILKNILGCGSTPTIRRQCFDTVGLFSPDLPLAQDWDMWLRIAAYYDFAVIKQPLVRYRKHSGNTSIKWPLMQKCSCLVLERAFQSAPADYLDSYDRAYTSLYLYLGWLAIRKQSVRQAFIFWRKSQETTPDWFSIDSIRLRLTIFTIRYLGGNNYRRLLRFGYRIRRAFLLML